MTALCLTFAVSLAGIAAVFVAAGYGKRASGSHGADVTEDRPEKASRRKTAFRNVTAIVVTPVLVAIQEFAPAEGSVDMSIVRQVGIAAAAIAVVALIVASTYHERRAEALARSMSALRRKNERADVILSHLVRLSDCKAASLRDKTYDLLLTEKDWPFSYGVHAHLSRICEELRLAVAEVAGIEFSKVDVSLIYRYKEANRDDPWRWAAGKSGLGNVETLNAFVKESGTLYHYILTHEDESPLFCNDKRAFQNYKQGSRDRLFESQGSFFIIRLVYANNDHNLMEAILLVSTYGANFAPPQLPDEVSEFKVALTHDIIPPFVSLMQVEFGALYARHHWNDLTCIDPIGKFKKNPVEQPERTKRVKNGLKKASKA